MRFSFPFHTKHASKMRKEKNKQNKKKHTHKKEKAMRVLHDDPHPENHIKILFGITAPTNTLKRTSRSD